jgi:drug/metabolite transporter (DMT)-like permease
VSQGATPTRAAATGRANVLLTLTAALWGFSFVAQRVGADHVEAFTFNGVRFALGSLSLLPLIAWLDHRRPPAARATRSALAPGCAAGALLCAAAALQQAGIASTTAGKASFITGLYIVIVPAAGIALGQSTTRRTWLGVALAVVGLYALTVSGRFTIAVGDALVFASAFFWAAHILAIGAFSARLDPLRLAAIQFAACALLSLAIALVTEDLAGARLVDAAIPILYGGLVSVGVAYTLQVVAQRDAKPAHAAIILSTETVFGAIGGALLLGEAMSARGYAGCALILAGIVVSQRGGTGDPEPIAPTPRASPGPPSASTAGPPE